MVDVVLAFEERDNALCIAHCAQLGYLDVDAPTLDPTYGLGNFWKIFRPLQLVAHDIDASKSPTGTSVDACNMPYGDGEFSRVVIDGPYKLNGTPTEEVDARFGVHVVASRAERMTLLHDMLVEGARVCGEWLLFKCQDQVNGGKVRWQTDIFTDVAREHGFGKVDRLEVPSYRPQPSGVRQVTARRNHSTMLVFKRGWRS